MTSLGNKDIFSKNLRYYIERSGKDRRELAEIWGFPYSTVTEWINGKKYPRIDRIEIMADYFGILKSDLIEDKSEDSLPLTRIPVLGAIACGNPIEAIENHDEYIQYVGKSKADFALICSGDSMVPTIMNGDYVLIRQQNDVNDGQIAAVVIDG